MNDSTIKIYTHFKEDIIYYIFKVKENVYSVTWDDAYGDNGCIIMSDKELEELLKN